jgi:hypothetical protein
MRKVPFLIVLGLIVTTISYAQTNQEVSKRVQERRAERQKQQARMKDMDPEERFDYMLKIRIKRLDDMLDKLEDRDIDDVIDRINQHQSLTEVQKEERIALVRERLPHRIATMKMRLEELKKLRKAFKQDESLTVEQKQAKLRELFQNLAPVRE